MQEEGAHTQLACPSSQGDAEDAVAVLQQGHDLTNADNGKVLALTNSSAWGSSGRKGSERD